MLAVRRGGHSYEGFSQSADVVIDVRSLNTITVDKSAGLVTAGSGASLYQVYQALAAQGLALQAGSCPTVGLSGHVMGGGQISVKQKRHIVVGLAVRMNAIGKESCI